MEGTINETAIDRRLEELASKLLTGGRDTQAVLAELEELQALRRGKLLHARPNLTNQGHAGFVRARGRLKLKVSA